MGGKEGKSGSALPDRSWFKEEAAGSTSTATSAGTFPLDPHPHRRQQPSPLPHAEMLPRQGPIVSPLIQAWALCLARSASLAVRSPASLPAIFSLTCACTNDE